MFVALHPSQTAVDDLEAFLAPRREAAAFRWAQSDQFHLTLAFYADVPDRRHDDLCARLERAARKRVSFETAVAGGGAFPNPMRARVLYAGLALDEAARTELDRLATGCRAAASRAGVAVDGQRFRPHLTLARLGHPEEVSNWVRLLDAYHGPAWIAERIELVASHLGEGPRGRPRYETVASFPMTVP